MFLRNLLIIALNFVVPGWGLAAATGKWALSLGVFFLHMAAVYFPAHILLGRASLSAPELLLLQAGTWTLLTALLSVFVLKMDSASEKTHLELSAALIFAAVSVILLAGSWLRGGSLFVARWVVAADDTLSPSLGRGNGAYCAKPPSGSLVNNAESYLGQIGLFNIDGERVLRRVLAVGAKGAAPTSLHVEPVAPKSLCFKANGRLFQSRVARATMDSGRLSSHLPPGTGLVGTDSLAQVNQGGAGSSTARLGQTLRTVSLRSLICLAEPVRSATAQDACP